ncbi:hypothetical protein [Paenibacillus sp. FSL R10-2734]|uniref:hypothetical protein n=1 Tax=Paenibacillus sp. FSL R10-2734 TaxID=2954691 RepID=UPI0030D89337
MERHEANRLWGAREGGRGTRADGSAGGEAELAGAALAGGGTMDGGTTTGRAGAGSNV